MGINFKESGDAIVAEKDGNGNWVLYNQIDDSANDPLLKIDEDTGETTWMDPPSDGVSNPMTEDLDAGGYSIDILLSQSFSYDAPIIFYKNANGKPEYKSIDPSETTTAGIQEAIDALPASGGRIILPPGNLTITDTISLVRNNVEIIGVSGGVNVNGEEGTVLDAFYLTDNVINIGDSGTSNDTTNVILKNFGIRGSSDVPRAINWYGYKTGCKLKNIFIKTVETGVYIDSSWYGGTIENISIRYCNTGIEINYSNGLTLQDIFIGNFGYYSQSPGIKIGGLSRGNKVIGGTVEGAYNNSTAIKLDDAPNTHLIAPYLEGTGHSIDIDGGTEGVIIEKGHGWSKEDIVITDGSDITYIADKIYQLDYNYETGVPEDYVVRRGDEWPSPTESTLTDIYTIDISAQAELTIDIEFINSSGLEHYSGQIKEIFSVYGEGNGTNPTNRGSSVIHSAGVIPDLALSMAADQCVIQAQSNSSYGVGYFKIKITGQTQNITLTTNI